MGGSTKHDQAVPRSSDYLLDDPQRDCHQTKRRTNKFRRKRCLNLFSKGVVEIPRPYYV